MKKLRGMVYTDKCVFEPCELTVEGNKITSVKSGVQLNDEERGVMIIPGLVDIHSHGCVGHDTCDADPAGLKEMLDYEQSHGTTSYLPTTMTYSEEILDNIMKAIAKVESPVLKGIYLEGPFISVKKKGAQNEKYIMKPDIEMLRRLNKTSGGLVKVVAIAPEEEGAMECIKAGKDEFKFSIAHTMADYDIAKEAIENGANHVTHLYNAMPAYSHRAPGVIGAAADDDTTRVELICDGIHVHEAVIRNTFKWFGDERVILISDSMEATGMPNGIYSLGGQTVYMENRKATLEDGTIAGSASNLMDCLKHVINIGIPMETAIAAATRNPAKEVGIYDRVGSIEEGKLSEVLIMDKDFELKKVIMSEEDI
ncbi:MAG: N-acetylglucosamine-6-phosphate deacetylase [Lachnospiraceae bacterium]|nr:N-acetylglucosamine-6-phosphate deacetylase [Lachnospiraceae bacterium]